MTDSYPKALDQDRIIPQQVVNGSTNRSVGYDSVIYLSSKAPYTYIKPILHSHLATAWIV